MKTNSLSTIPVFMMAILLAPCAAFAQQAGSITTRSTAMVSEQRGQANVPPAVQQATETTERVVKRFRIGVSGGVALDPELIDFGAHAAFAPVFNRNVEFRPGIEFGVGELTTLFGINLDVLYFLPGSNGGTRWMPYVGAGPNFSLSHQGFETPADSDQNRFDFSDTDFDGGFNFITGARSQGGVFFEMKATAYGVSNIRLIGGFNF